MARTKRSKQDAAASEEPLVAVAAEEAPEATETTDAPETPAKKAKSDGNDDNKEQGDSAPLQQPPMFPMFPGYFNPFWGGSPYGYMPPPPSERKDKDGDREEGKDDEAKMDGPRGPFPPHPMMFPHPMFMMMMHPPASASRGVLLAMQCDVEQLSDYQMLVRQQLELFEAGAEDVESNTQGRKKPVVMGQVGLRCRHCSILPLRARSRGAVYYPSRLTGLYQAAQNMAASHLCQACQTIPQPIKNELRKLRERRDNASGGKNFWADSARAQFVIETDSGLRFQRPDQPPMVAAPASGPGSPI